MPKAELTPELEVYYNYTCQEGGYIKTCTVPSPKLDETDLEGKKDVEDLEDLKASNYKKSIPDERGVNTCSHPGLFFMSFFCRLVC